MASIPKIVARGRITDADAPTLSSFDYGALLGGHANVIEWFTPKPSFMTLAGSTVTSMLSRKGTGFTLLAPGDKPNYLASDAHFNGRPSVAHDSGGSGDILNYNGGFSPVAGDFFKVAIVYFASEPAAINTVGISTLTSGARHYMTYQTANFRHVVGASGTAATASRPFSTGLKCLIGCWSAADKRSRISIDLGATWDEGTHASAAASITTGMHVGEESDFKWADQMFGNIDLSKSNATAIDLLAKIAGYARDIVGVVPA